MSIHDHHQMDSKPSVLLNITYIMHVTTSVSRRFFFKNVRENQRAIQNGKAKDTDNIYHKYIMHNVQDNGVLYNNISMAFYSHVETTCMISSFQ